MHLAVILRYSMHRRFCSRKFQIARARARISVRSGDLLVALEIHHVSRADEDIESLTLHVLNTDSTELSKLISWSFIISYNAVSRCDLFSFRR